jgi:hypothetical protein
VGELIDHQPDGRILADALGIDVFVLAHLSAGDRQRDTARIAGAGIDNHQRIAEAAAGGVLFQT